MVACVGTISNFSANGVNLLPDDHPEKLSNIVGNYHLKWKAPGANQLAFEVADRDMAENLEIEVEPTGDDHNKVKPLDADNRLDYHIQERDEQYDDENEIRKAPIGGREISSRNEVGDVQGSILPESSLDTGSHVKKKHNGKKKKRHVVHDLALKEIDVTLPVSDKDEPQQEILMSKTSMKNVHEIVSHDTVTCNKNITDATTGASSKVQGTSSKVQRASSKVQRASSKVQRAAILSEGTGELGKHITGKNDEFGKNNDDVQYDMSMEDTLQSEPVANKKRKIEKENKGGEDLLKQDETLISNSHEEMLKPCTISQKNTNVTFEGPSIETSEAVDPSSRKRTRKRKKKSSDTPNQEIAVVSSSGTIACNECLADPKDLGEELVSRKHFQALIDSEIDAVSLKEKHGDSVQDGGKRPSSQEFDINNSYTGIVESVHHASGSAIASNTKGIRVSKDHHANNMEDNPNLEVQESDQVEEERDLLNFSLKPSEKNKPSDQDEIGMKSSETVNPINSSKKKKKSEKTNEFASATPSTSVTEHTKGFVSELYQNEPNKASNGDHSGDNINKEESIIPPKAGTEVSEIDTMSTTFLASDKEIDDVIKNAVESVQQIGKGQMHAENSEGKSRKKKKKQRSDARNIPESAKENENFGSKVPAPSADNTREVDYLSKEMKQGNLANKDSINQLNESNLEGEKSTRVENDPLDIQSSQKRGEIGFYGDVAVNKAPKAKVVNGEIKTKKENKKHDKHSHGPSSDLQSSLMLNENCGVGAKPQAGNSSTVDLQGSLSNTESEKTMLHSNEEPLQVSDNGVKSLPSSKSGKLNSVPEEASRSSVVKPSVIVARSKTKMAESNSSLGSSKNIGLLNTKSSERKSSKDPNRMDGRNTSTINSGDVVNSSQHKKSLIGSPGSIFKDDSEGASSIKDDTSDASTRTPSDNSLSSDYSDGESNADLNSSQNGSYSWKRNVGGGKAFKKPIDHGITLDMILRSSSSYKKAKLTASQNAADTESQPVDFVPDSQGNT
ncbi:hypothetical protein JCGZ_17880 [Jatropha curcas]|uniref:Uncharacterized protein n=2 Tax=Jatropha curcas TaxID=180498 RepID=A0A067JS92_JATCU|nr:uncharacterized protein LOC105644723 isoform X2 [Jatropha curcas]KDP26722.1 hypothetical protein JCGZ_17880 [Jatropha curcas]